MFDKRKETDGLVEAAVAVLGRYGPGDVVPHSELSEAMGHSPEDGRYYALAFRARKLHRDAAGVWSRPINGVGYLLLTPQDQLTDEQSRRSRRARRQIGIGHDAANAIPDESITEHQRKIKQFVLTATTKQRKELLADERHQKWLLKPPSDRPITVRPPRADERAVANGQH